LFNIVYQKRLKKSKIVRLFTLMDKDNKEYLNLNDFFDLIDIMENNKDLSKPEPRSFKPWVR
jgi:Ca2+-binding EF-hand superfamily protein